MDSKNHQIQELKIEVGKNKIQMALDKKQIHDLKEDLNNLHGGFQICRKSVANVLTKFNSMFPEYKVEPSPDLK